MSAEVVKLFNEGKFAEAQSKAKEVVSIRERKLGRNHLLLAASWRNLALVEIELKDMKAAESAFDRALEILESNQPLSNANERVHAEMLEAAAYFDVKNGTLGKSEVRLQRAIEIREKLDGKDAASVAVPLQTLGQIYHGRREYDKAVPVLTRALEIKFKGKNTLNEEDILLKKTVGCSLIKLERADEARQLNEKFRSSELTASKIPEIKTINAGVVNGRAIQLPKPAYPVEARRNRDAGAVAVEVLINEVGKVVFACAVSGAKTLQGPSENAAYLSKFSPTKLEGKPVKVSGVLTYNFVP